MTTRAVGSGGNGSSRIGWQWVKYGQVGRVGRWAGYPKIEYIPKSSKSWERIRGIYSLLVRKEYYRFQSFMSWIINLKKKKKKKKL